MTADYLSSRLFSLYLTRCENSKSVIKSGLFFVLAFFSFAFVSSGQTTDSTQIATFFSPQNIPNINQKSKDSLCRLVDKSEKLQDIYRWHEAKLLLQTGQFDEAFTKANKGILEIPKGFSDYSKAKYYNIIGSVHANKQETKRAIQYFEKALRLSEEAKETINAALMESNIANMYFSLVDYESAYKYAKSAFEKMESHPEHPFYSSLVAVLSISEAKVGKMKSAKKHGKIALKNAESSGSLIAIIVANLALGEVANSEKKYDEAKKHLSASLELSEKYQQKPFIILNSIGLTVASLGTKNYSEAVEYGEKALALVDQGGDKTTTYSVKKYLAEAYFGINQPQKAYRLMKEAHAVFRDKNSIENKKAINDILVKYDTEKKEKDLIASRNELLQKKVERNNLLLILGLLALVTIGLVLGILFIRHRNQNRIALLNSVKAKEVLQAVFDGEEVERERIAHELHDGVASNLTAVRYQLMANENIPAEDKAQLEGILLQAHEDTRRLSHNLAPIYLEKFGFEEALKQFANENSTDKCKVYSSVLPAGSEIPKVKANVLYRVAQELTQNAIKHAEANEISIQVTVGDFITLLVEDDGLGFDFESKKDSNGMASILRRANQLAGSFEIDSNANHGTIANFIIS